MSLTEDRENLENDIENLQELVDLAQSARAVVYDLQRKASELILENVELSENGTARELEDEADAAAEHVGDAYELAASLMQQAHNLLADLPDSEPCDECGELIPEDEGEGSDAHASWCPELETNKEE